MAPGSGRGPWRRLPDGRAGSLRCTGGLGAVCIAVPAAGRTLRGVAKTSDSPLYGFILPVRKNQALIGGLVHVPGDLPVPLPAPTWPSPHGLASACGGQPANPWVGCDQEGFCAEA